MNAAHRQTAAMPRFHVMIDDNFHYMDESERFAHGGYDTLEAAMEACRRIVDRDLGELNRSGMSADELYRQYVFFGSDPYILGGGVGENPFSAWDYARERSRAIASRTG